MAIPSNPLPPAAPPGGHRLRVKTATAREEVQAAIALRQRVFRDLRGRGGAEEDAWDSRCQHVLILAEGQAEPIACYRMMHLAAQDAGLSYTAQYHDIDDLCDLDGPIVEVGRLCVTPNLRDPDVIRLALAVMVQRAAGARALFGCASFEGADPARHRAALSWLAARPEHILQRDLNHPHTPQSRMPPAPVPSPAGGAEAAGLPAFRRVVLPPADADASPAGLPPLLRAYLSLGAVVSPDGVIDPDLDTLHLRVTLDPGRIPPARLRSLLALAAAVPG